MVSPTARKSEHIVVANRRLAHQALECQWHGPEPSSQGPPVVIMLHEGLGCVDMWRDVPAELAARTGAPVMVFSRLGYGRSDPCPLPRDVSYMHDEGLIVLPALIQAAGIGRHVLFGHSDGASIALIAAGGSPSPGLAGIVLEAPHIFTEAFGLESIARALQQYETADLRPRLQKYHGDNVDCAFHGWAGPWLHADFVAWDIREYLAAITVPVLAIQGAADEYGSLAQLDGIEAGVSGPFHRLVLPDCGHSPHRDQRPAVMNAAGNFIRGL
jgi:pimeloyl-ACP methyl ester carboxylesterase